MAKRKLPGRLVVIEGPDGVGKSTICRLLLDNLSSQGIACELLSFPGKTAGSIGELVYRVHHDQKSLGVETLSPLARQALHIAAHIDVIDRQIVPLLEAGKVVILDRFWWSAWVYGLVNGCHRRKLSALVEAERSSWGSIKPDLAVQLRCPSPIGRDAKADYWNRLSQEYSRLAEREQRLYPVAVIDNTGTPEDVLEMLLEQLGTRVLPSKGRGVEQLSIGFAEPKNKAQPASHILPIRPSIVYDSYWRFAVERQDIFFKRVLGARPPWTRDPVLSEYKFTNAYRASDRVSQYLIRHVIYRDDLPTSPDEVFFRIMLFKFFNKIETWEGLEKALGAITLEDYSFPRYDRVLTKTMERGEAIYSAAYIMPSGGQALGHDRKHRNHLALLERMVTESLPERLTEASSMQKAFSLLRSYPSIGDFLAYQYVTDINYSELTDFSESDFVVPGPGSLDGIRKCFIDRGGLSEPEIIKFMAERQEQEFARLGLAFKSLWGRPLQLIDCQNLFCEVDKYARVMHPEIAGISGRLRIKQRFEETPQFPKPWYPPKWKLNALIDKSPALSAKTGSAAHSGTL
jgi:thymidylate kinase